MTKQDIIDELNEMVKPFGLISYETEFLNLSYIIWYFPGMEPSEWCISLDCSSISPNIKDKKDIYVRMPEKIYIKNFHLSIGYAIAVYFDYILKHISNLYEQYKRGLSKMRQLEQYHKKHIVDQMFNEEEYPHLEEE